MKRIKAPGTTMGFAAAAVILVAVGALVILSARRAVFDSQMVAHTYAVIAELENIRATNRDAISSQRSYLLTNDGRDRARLLAAIPPQLQSLKELVQDNPAQLRLIAVLEPKMLQRLVSATRTMAIAEQQGLPQAQIAMKTNVGRALDTEISGLLETMRDNERQLLTTRSKTTEFSSNLLLLSASLGIALSLLILGAIYRLLAKESSERRKSELIASAASVELQDSLAQSRKLSSDMEALSKYAGMLQSCNEIPELLHIACQTMAGLMPDIAGTIYLIRASRDHAEAVTNWGEHRAQSNPLPLPSDCWALRRNQPFFCNNLHADVKCAHVELPPPGQITATACLPLSAQGEVMGWLYLSGPGPGPLPDMSLALLAAEPFSLALANLRLKEVLRQQSIRDPLTGLFNRRYLEESLGREISRCQRRQLPLVVLMFDIDRFKAFNDHHGHPGGDALLASFGRLLQSSCRPEDIACRYGGEEFTLILPEVNETIGMERAMNILNAAAQMVESHQGSPLSRITTSIGMAVLPKNGTTNTSLIAAADKALYQAKAQGRNRVVMAIPES